MTKSIGKLVAIPLAAAALLLVSTQAAFAEDKTPSPRPSASAKPNHEEHNDDAFPGLPSLGRPQEDDDTASHHRELHDKYGNDVDQVILPPLVVSGEKANSAGLGQSPVGISPANPPAIKSPLKTATEVNPTANLPINPDATLVSNVTPADVFFQQATFGLGILGVGAVSLGAVAFLQRRSNRLDARDTYSA